MNKICLSTLVLLLSACATGPRAPETAVHTDGAARERSRAYMAEYGVAMADADQSGSTCRVPTEHMATGARPPGPSKDWRSMMAQAAACAKDKNWRDLETLGNLMAKLDVDSPWGAYYLSLAAEGHGDTARAFWMLELANKKAGTSVGIFSYEKARLYLDAKDTKMAIDEMKKALSYDGRFSDGHLFLAHVYHRDLEFDRAEQSYSAALSLEPSNYEALLGMAMLKVETGHADQAVGYYKRAYGVRSTADVKAQIQQLEGQVKRAPAQVQGSKK